MKIGILAIQGAFAEHISMLKRLNVETFEIRQLRDLENNDADGYILPGGESTVMGKLLRELQLFFPYRNVSGKGLPFSVPARV